MGAKSTRYIRQRQSGRLNPLMVITPRAEARVDLSILLVFTSIRMIKKSSKKDEGWVKGRKKGKG